MMSRVPSPAPAPTHGASPARSPVHGASPVPSPTHGASPVPSPTHGASPVPSPTHGASPVPAPSQGSSVRPPPPPGVATGNGGWGRVPGEVRVTVPDNLRGERDFCVPGPGAWTHRSRRPFYEDASAGRAIDGLRNKPAPISGEDFEKALLAGTRDLDGRGAGAEYRDFKRFAYASWDKLSPDAKAKWRVYEATAQACRARGLEGIPAGEHAAMARALHHTKADLSGVYRDRSARGALSALESRPGPIGGDDFLRAFRQGTADLDGQVFGQELADFARFADRNWPRMTPDARAAFLTYQSHALGAALAGEGGVGAFDFRSLHAEMKASADLVKQRLSGCGRLRI